QTSKRGASRARGRKPAATLLAKESLMFASHWTTSQGGRSAGRKRAWILTSSLLLHVVALATLAGADAWQVRAVAEPPIPEVFEVQLPLPILPPPPPVNEPK